MSVTSGIVEVSGSVRVSSLLTRPERARALSARSTVPAARRIGSPRNRPVAASACYTGFGCFNLFRLASMKAGMSRGSRLVIRLPSSTTSRS